MHPKPVKPEQTVPFWIEKKAKEYNNLWLNFDKWSTIKLLCTWEILCPCWRLIWNASFTLHLSTFILSWEKDHEWLYRVTEGPHKIPRVHHVFGHRLVSCGTWGLLQKSLSVMAVRGSWLKSHDLMDMIFQSGSTKKMAKVTWAKTRKIINPELRCGSGPLFKNPYNGGKCRIFFQKLKTAQLKLA